MARLRFHPFVGFASLRLCFPQVRIRPRSCRSCPSFSLFFPPNPTPTVLSQHIDGRREVERERRNPLTPVSKCTRGGGPSDGRTDTPHDSRHTARGRKRWRADAPRPKQIHDGVCSCTPTGPGWTSSPLPSPATWQRRNFRIQTRDACDRRMRWIRHGRPSNRGERRMRDACYV